MQRNQMQGDLAVLLIPAANSRMLPVGLASVVVALVVLWIVYAR